MEPEDKVREVVTRLQSRLEALIEPICTLLDAEGLDVWMLVHNDQRAAVGEIVSASLLAPGIANLGQAIKVLTACVRRIIHRAPLERVYSTSAAKLIKRLGVVSWNDVEMVLCWNASGNAIGELVLKRGESAQLAAALRLGPSLTAEERAKLAGWQTREAFEAEALQLERAAHDLCSGHSLGAIAAAIHGLVCGNEALCDALLAIDATCEHKTQEQSAAATAAKLHFDP